jgi:hypothetical protein
MAIDIPMSTKHFFIEGNERLCDKNTNAGNYLHLGKCSDSDVVDMAHMVADDHEGAICARCSARVVLYIDKVFEYQYYIIFRPLAKKLRELESWKSK